MPKSTHSRQKRRKSSRKSHSNSPKEPKVICPHCHKQYTQKTVREHIAQWRAKALLRGEQIDLFPEVEPNESTSLPDPNIAPNDSEHSISFEGTPDPHGNNYEMDHSSPEQVSPPQNSSIRHNPPVTIEDWPEPELDTVMPDNDNEAVPAGPGSQEYANEENANDDSDRALGFAELSDAEFHDLLRRALGDAFDDEMEQLYNQAISEDDTRIIKMLSAKIRAHFSRQTYNEIRQAFYDELGLPSEYVSWRRVRILSGLECRAFDCCINSCCAFLGKYKAYNTCPFCRQVRFNSRGKPRKVFHYTPLIPQLQILYANLKLIKLLQYRSEQDASFSPTKIRDIFDGNHYRSLLGKHLHPTSLKKLFDDIRDLALGLSLDGFTLFKRRRKGNSTAWPLIIINYNFAPEIRTHFENVICVGVIPGPQQFKDLNSFLIPLLEELLELESGVPTRDFSAPRLEQIFDLHAFLIVAFGDIPALSKLMGVKGHNAIYPCRLCDIAGIKDGRPKSHTHYVPMTQPGRRQYWDPFDLPMRSSESFRTRIAKIEAASTKTAREKLSRDFGINSRCILSRLRSIEMASSFPYDFMHLIYENLVPNLIRHWTGTFKNLDQGSEHYELTLEQWKAIGLETALAILTIPAFFVGTLPDIAEDQSLYKAEAYGFWIQYIAPIVLKNRLSDKYHRHLVDLREILDLCLQYEITMEQIDDLEVRIIRWVADYEAYYYQYKQARVSTCPLTIHALLHIPYCIRQVGPVWTSWAYVMERFCGRLLPCVKNRLNPYPCIDNYILRRAQMQIISAKYEIPTIKIPPSQPILTAAAIEISRHETVYDEYPLSVLGRPVTKAFPATVQLMNQFISYFQLVLHTQGRTLPEIEEIITESLIRYGRVRIANGGDSMRTSDLFKYKDGERNASYVRLNMFPDRNATRRRANDDPYRQINYGELQDIFYIELRDHGDPEVPQKFLLARVLLCKLLKWKDGSKELAEYQEMESSPRVVNLLTIEGAIGRVRRHKTWGIIDRSRNAVRTLFTDNDNAPVE